jgi:tryptophan 7-halogenase
VTQNIIVLGAGSAGLLAALALRRRLPHINLRVIRSPDLGIIGVGEGTTPIFPQMLFDYLGLKRRQFFEEAAPIWKLGGRFLWGSRPAFNYPFEITFERRLPGLSRASGFYCRDGYDFVTPPAAFMATDKVFPRRADGMPEMHEYYAFHLENERLVRWLENVSVALGVKITDGRVVDVEKSADGVAALKLESGERVTGDLFIDCSGFRSELLGKALEVPMRSYSASLFCDRAVVGGWKRDEEPIQPYTTQETMDHGWCWRIDHETIINRGYVYSSRFTTDDAAREEFLRKNPKVDPEKTRVVKFTSGRRELAWKGNVVGMGNAAAFVEPLEATALSNLSLQIKLLVQVLEQSDCEPTPTLRDIYNVRFANWWDDTRDFLALHYKFNTKLDTPFWQTCRAESDLGLLDDFVKFYQENGPTRMCLHALPHGRAIYGLEGHLAVLVGCGVPYQRKVPIPPAEDTRWRQLQAEHRRIAERAMDAKQVLEAIRKPTWSWEKYQPARGNTALQL